MLSVELPSGVADMELPSGLTTLLSDSEVTSQEEPRNSTAITAATDPRSYFEGAEFEEVDLSCLGVVCDCGKLLSK